jgi:hypothetical protein
MATNRRRESQKRAQRDISKALLGGYKMTESKNKITQAKRQLKQDVMDFKKNRAAGDREMLGSARENGKTIHEGGPSQIQKPNKNVKGAIDRKTIESSVSPSRGTTGAQAEKKIAKERANKKQPKQADVNDAKRLEQLEGIEELKKKKSTRT